MHWHTHTHKKKQFIPWSIIAVFLFMAWHSTSCNFGFCLSINFSSFRYLTSPCLTLATSQHAALPLKSCRLSVSSYVHVWIWMKVYCYRHIRDDSVNKEVVASNVVIVQRQFCDHANNLKNLGKTFRRMGKQWLSFCNLKVSVRVFTVLPYI